MAFTNARDQNGGLIPLPIVPSQNNANEYTADATVVWIVAGPTWPYFLPVTPNTLVVRFADVEQGDPTINIASFSDVNIAITETKLTIFLLGFSVLMLQPIFEALLGLETPKQNLQAKPPLFHWPHRKPKKSQSQVPPTASV